MAAGRTMTPSILLHNGFRRRHYASQWTYPSSLGPAVLVPIITILLVGTASAEVLRARVPGRDAPGADQLATTVQRGAAVGGEEAQGGADVTASEDDALWSSRQPRSPLSPPTVTSQQPHRRGVSLLMLDSSLLVGRQSEGPSHPALMRKAPHRRLASNLVEDEDNMERPHTMFHLPKETSLMQPEGHVVQGARTHHDQYRPLQTPVANRFHSENMYEAYQAGQTTAQRRAAAGRGAESSRQADDESRSRQRRVENSSQRREGDDDVVRHGRFEEFLGNREIKFREPLERYDTFGHAISEELWTGHRRSATPIHPAARAVPNRGRTPSQTETSIWSRGFSRRYGNPRLQHPHASVGHHSNQGDHVTNEEPASGRTRGNVLVHPGTRMSSRGPLSGGRQQETIIIHGSGDQSPDLRRMFSPRGRAPSPSLDDTVSLAEVMNRMNQSYEELIRNLEVKGLSLTYLLRLLGNGTSLEDIVQILEFSNPHVPTTTTLEPITRTVDPTVWEPWLNQDFQQENREFGTANDYALEIDRRNEDNPYFSDPIYAVGVQPINEDMPTVHETNTSTVSPYEEISQSSIQPSNYSYDDYYYEDEENRKTSGQARIHSFTVHELPYDQKHEIPQTNQYIQTDPSDYLSSNPHPYYNRWDQIYESNNPDNSNAEGNDLRPQSSSNVLLKPAGGDDWSYVGEAESNSRPLAYTVIAASAIMGSLAVFTFFVLIAYSIVKCTKKPTLNNYQVSDKKPVEITT